METLRNKVIPIIDAGLNDASQDIRLDACKAAAALGGNLLPELVDKVLSVTKVIMEGRLDENDRIKVFDLLSVLVEKLPQDRISKVFRLIASQLPELHKYSINTRLSAVKTFAAAQRRIKDLSNVKNDSDDTEAMRNLSTSPIAFFSTTDNDEDAMNDQSNNAALGCCVVS